MKEKCYMCVAAANTPDMKEDGIEDAVALCSVCEKPIGGLHSSLVGQSNTVRICDNCSVDGGPVLTAQP